ncbi:putative ATPase family protein [Tetraselmis virus 1]|uniref:Putative ATPase family protein n=1 Tax=Tetraselmis virus 1 TaxID=2060617 RepID=A0A2P0VMP8_9VIRU|nr:putative ATPase family protein [Tetraselmis virus 1]AUF82177.1 putative ATPase family protein [Tetraselmis virus 1]
MDVDANYIGISKQINELNQELEDYKGEDTRLIIIIGPPGSGRTSVCKDLLKKNNYNTHTVSANECISKEISKIMFFCGTIGNVDVLLSGTGDSKRSVFVDDVISDIKTVVNTYDALKKKKNNVLMIICCNRTTKITSVQRRAKRIIEFDYPKITILTEFMKKKFPNVPRDAIKRCVKYSNRCVQKCVMLIESEQSGTKATESIKLVDCSIFDEVQKAISVIDKPYSDTTFSDIEVATSSEPGLCLLIIRDAVCSPRVPITKETFLDFNFYVKIQPSEWFSTLASTVIFYKIAKQCKVINKFKFPKCYTIMSTRMTNIKKQLSWLDDKKIQQLKSNYQFD